MQTLYTAIKVNNEIELCEISDMDFKQLIEKELLKRRISYFIRFNSTRYFFIGRKKNICILCVNDSVKDEAETVVKELCAETGIQVKFLFKKSSNNFL